MCYLACWYNVKEIHNSLSLIDLRITLNQIWAWLDSVLAWTPALPACAVLRDRQSDLADEFANYTWRAEVTNRFSCNLILEWGSMEVESDYINCLRKKMSSNICWQLYCIWFCGWCSEYGCLTGLAGYLSEICHWGINLWLHFVVAPIVRCKST